MKLFYKIEGPYQGYIEGFNILCIFGLSYFIYKQIDFIHEPNVRNPTKLCALQIPQRVHLMR